MKQNKLPIEFVYQLFALIIAVIVVHAIYVSVVRPNAADVLEQQAIEAAANPDYVRERSTWVLIKDLEQEACFILMIWALAIMGFKARNLMHERRLLDHDLVPIAEGMRILPEDTREFARQVQALPEADQDKVLPRALLNALRRFSTTRNIQDVSSNTHTIFESEVRRSPRLTRPYRVISQASPRASALLSTRRSSRS